MCPTVKTKFCNRLGSCNLKAWECMCVCGGGGGVIVAKSSTCYSGTGGGGDTDIM